MVCRIHVAQLKHSWLENQFLGNAEDQVIFLWRQGPWAALEAEFDARIDQARQVAAGMVECFSPAEIVNTCGPLAVLSKELKEQIGLAVHAAYLKGSRIELLRQELLALIPRLEVVMGELRVAWSGPRTQQGQLAVRSAWRDFRHHVEAMHSMLARMPNNVYLP